jgi:LysM repeat protein
MSNSGKVKCTCGWSWNKSDSSKKDMYICHECGRDNSNNMKNGGWLDSYADGGTMQEHQENYNDPQVSLPEGFVGMGNNTKGRDYSPAWGGQFQNGGPIKPSQKDYKTKGEYNAALKSYNVNLHKYELANNPERLKGESAKDYETRTKYFNFKIRQEQDKDPITKSYLEMKDDQETATNPIAKTLRQVFTSPAHVAHGIYNAANPKGLDKYKSRATKNDEDLDLVNSSLDAASLLVPFDSGMKADALWKQALIRTAKEVVEDGVFNTAKKANQWLLSNFQGGGSVYPVNYVPQAQNGEDVVSWTKEYVKSPKYKERITNAGYDDPDKQIGRRLQNLENVNIVDTSNPRGTVYKPSKNTIETGYPTDLEYYNIHKNLYPTKPELNSIIAHELGHSETNRKGSATSLLNKRDREELKNRLRPGSDEDLEVYINGELKHDRSKHNIIPEENKSDLNSFRYDLRNMYDAGNEDFTEEYLKNSPDSFAKERLLKNYSPEDLIWLMNNVAQNKESNQQGNVAQMGASIPGAVGFSYARVGAPSKGPRRNQTDVTDASAQNGKEMKYYQEGLDFQPKSISKNGGWLNKYDVAQAGAQVEYGTPEYEESYNKGEVVTDEGGRSPILLDEVVVEGKPLTEFGKTRKEIAAKNKWEDYAQKYLGNFEKNMGQTLENLPESRKQEYEDYINKLAFDEYIKTHPQAKGEKRGAYIDRMQAENANSSNFERAYEANADYNDATDVNKWRKGLIGLGSFVMGPGAINDLKQTSDYFSTKEKQDLIENPILSNIDTTLGTLEPLTIPVEGIYGNKSFGDIASGQSANIPMTARILGDPLMLGFEAAPLIMEGVKGLRGASTIAKALSEESAMSKLNMVDEAVASKPWSMEELPGLHLQSTMDNGAISKIVEPKSGLINTEQALAIIGKESGGSDKVALIKQGLGETIPKKIDYNEFRKIVQDQLIPLDTQIVNHSSNYGISSLGYPSSKRSSFEMAIENLKQDLQKEIKILEETKAKGYEYTDIENHVNHLKERIAVTEASLKTLPLENKTFVFGNKENFGRGSSAHNNPKETLGHAHYLIDSETPDVLTVTQLQSDAFQGTHRMMPKSLEDAMVKLDDVKGNAKEVYKVFGDESEKFKDVLDNADEYLKLEKNHIKNFNQKILLDKNHQERYLQEIVANAAKRGDINKVRVPTSETAANVQGYVSQKHWNVNIKEGDEVVLLDGTKGKITDDTFDNITEITTSDGQKVNVNFTMLEFGKSKTLPVKSINNTELKEVTGYMPEHQTILKKYKEQPKLIKKLFGEEPTIVTDSKGNTWYEFEIPKNFKEGKGQIKAFKEGGIIKDDRGQWAYPGEVTEIGSNQITMQGVPYPVLGVSNTGDTQMMYPEEEYEFDGEKVTEYPIAQNGFDAKAFQKVLDEKFPRSWRNKKDINIRETNPVKKDNINVKKKNEIIIPTKKENAARSIQDQKQYMKDYMDSPMYNEMVDNSTTGISDKFFLNLSRDHNYDTAKVTLMNRNLTGEDKNVGANSNSTTGAIKVFPKGYQGPQLEGMISHEISHTIDKPVKWKDKARSIHEFLGNPYMDEKRIIPKKDIDLMQSYYKGNDYYKELFNKNALNNAALNEDREWFNYVSDPTETRARLNDIRYNAKKYNIYDPFTEKVDVEKLNEIRKLSKKAGGFDPFNQLRDVYSEDQIINMLNTISQNDTEEDRSVSVAKNGIRQEQKGLQNLDQLTNFTNYNTKQPGGWLEKFAVGGIVPGGTTPDESYDIKEGDTLFEIARDNNVPLNTLANTNKLTNPDLIKTGDKLVIPKKYKKELSFNEIPTTDNKKIVIDNFSKHYDYIVEGDKTYYKVKSGNTWADISGNKEARANLLKFLDKNDYWKGYGSGEKAKFDKVNHEPVIVPGGKVPKTTPTVIRNTQTGNKPAIVKRPIAKVVKEEPGFFDEVSDFVSSGYESLQNKWKDVKEQTDLVKSVVEESVKLGVNTAIQTTEDAYHTLVNGIDRKFKTHTGEDNDVKIETKISQTPKTVKEWYGNTSGAEITQVIDAPNTDGRIYKQQVLPTSNIKFGVRNRGEYKDITTDGLEITTFNSFSKDPLPENTTVLAVDPGGNLHTGTYKDFKGKKDYLFSKTFRNNIIDFSEVNGKGQYISGQKSGNPKYQLPKIKVLDDNGKVVDGSLNILVKDDSKKDYYGQVQGGRVLFVNPDTKQQYLVSGTINHIKQKFKELKGNSKYLEAYTLDNGTYSRGLSYKDKKLTKNRLKSYDLENTGGGNGLYIIDYKQPVNKYEEDYIDNMPNIRTKNDTSYKKGHALKNEVKNIVLHHTAYTGPNAEKELNKQYMTKGNNSSHIVIQENGKRTIYASPEQVTFHAGESEWNKRKDVNDFSIGVEFQGDTNKKPLTQAQIESFVEYYATIAKKYNLSLKDIITHQMIAPGRKPDINEKQYARILKYMRDKKFK